MEYDYHLPVLLQQSVEGLNIDPDGVYIDATFGGGGHAKYILEKLSSKGKLIAFDQDGDAINNEVADSRLLLIDSNFRYVKNYLNYYQIIKVNGVLMDLGVSSYQFDSTEKGFAFRFSQELDMRMNLEMPLSAKDVLNTYSVKELWKIFEKYGEVRNAKTLANKIIDQRIAGNKISTTDDFNHVLKECCIGNVNQYFAQVYQAVRIEVNEELESLVEFMDDIYDFIASKGRMVVISYHSLEDRIVKNMIKTGSSDGEMQRDDFGKITRPYKVLTKKPMVPEQDEMRRNTRSRSAKMRIAEKQ